MPSIQPVVNDRDEPIGDNWKPEVCPRHNAHCQDKAVIYAAALLSRHFTGPTKHKMLASFGLDRGATWVW